MDMSKYRPTVVNVRYKKQKRPSNSTLRPRLSKTIIEKNLVVEKVVLIIQSFERDSKRQQTVKADAAASVDTRQMT